MSLPPYSHADHGHPHPPATQPPSLQTDLTSAMGAAGLVTNNPPAPAPAAHPPGSVLDTNDPSSPIMAYLDLLAAESASSSAAGSPADSHAHVHHPQGSAPHRPTPPPPGLSIAPPAAAMPPRSDLHIFGARPRSPAGPVWGRDHEATARERLAAVQASEASGEVSSDMDVDLDQVDAELDAAIEEAEYLASLEEEGEGSEDNEDDSDAGLDNDEVDVEAVDSGEELGEGQDDENKEWTDEDESVTDSHPLTSISESSTTSTLSTSPTPAPHSPAPHSDQHSPTPPSHGSPAVQTLPPSSASPLVATPQSAVPTLAARISKKRAAKEMVGSAGQGVCEEEADQGPAKGKRQRRRGPDEEDEEGTGGGGGGQPMAT